MRALIILGKLAMLSAWGVLVYCFINPVLPQIAKIGFTCMMIFVFIMHCLQLLMVKSALKDTPHKISTWQTIQICFLGSPALMEIKEKYLDPMAKI